MTHPITEKSHPDNHDFDCDDCTISPPFRMRKQILPMAL